jgi:hypothetical protein
MRITIVSNEKNSKIISLHGKSRANNMYIRGVDYLSGNFNSESMILVDLEQTDGEEKDGGKEEAKEKRNAANKGVGDKNKQAEMAIPSSILVTLYSMPSGKSPGEYLQAEKIIHIGCMKSTSDKKDAKRVGILLKRVLNSNKTIIVLVLKNVYIFF